MILKKSEDKTRLGIDFYFKIKPALLHLVRHAAARVCETMPGDPTPVLLPSGPWDHPKGPEENRLSPLPWRKTVVSLAHP